MRGILALWLLVCSSASLAAQMSRDPVVAASACDRECLRGKIGEVLYALADHDLARLSTAPTLRVTEDGVVKPLAQVGLARSVTKLRGYRQDVLDERTGQAVAGAMVDESGAPVILVVRLKLDREQRLDELELVATRSRADGLLFNVDAYSGAPAKAMTMAPPGAACNT